MLTGCKNIAEAEKAGEREVFVPAWGIRLAAEKPVRDGLKAVGIRAHSFDPDEPRNRFPVSIVREMEEPFEWISEFRYSEQAPGSPAVWWRYPKASRTEKKQEVLGVPPEDVLLLYGE
jgi:molybdate transport system ATP-binding protein